MRDQRAGPLRPGLRHLHPARPRRRDGHRQVPQAVPDRQGPAADRGHLAVVVRQLLLAERPGARQRPQRRRHGPVGHPRQAGRHAGLPALRRQVPRGRRHVYRHASGRDLRGGRAGRRRLHGRGLPPRPHPGRGARAGRPTAPAPAETPAPPRRRANRRAGLWEPGAYVPHRAEAVRAPAQATSATRWSCCTTCTSACRRSWPCSWPRISSRTSPFFLEDPLQPRGRRLLREAAAADDARRSRWASCSTTPTNTCRSSPNRLIDFIRIHLSQIGGLTHGPEGGGAVRVLRASAPPGTAPATSRRSATPPTSTSTWRSRTSASRKARELHARPSRTSSPAARAEGRLLSASTTGPAWASTSTRSWPRSSRSPTTRRSTCAGERSGGGTGRSQALTPAGRPRRRPRRPGSISLLRPAPERYL